MTGPDYAVRYVRKHGVDDYRGDRILGDLFKVTKFEPPDRVTEYEVILSELGDLCNCPGSRHADCKHRRMAREHRDRHPVG